MRFVNVRRGLNPHRGFLQICKGIGKRGANRDLYEPSAQGRERTPSHVANNR